MILEITIFIICIVGINYFVDNTLYSDNYITHWENYNGPGVTPNVENAKKEIIRNRQSAKKALYIISIFALISYYCGKTARIEMRNRRLTPPLNLILSNRKVVFMRMISLLMGILFLFSFFVVFASSPMFNMTEEGLKITNPFFGKDRILALIICGIFPLFFSFGLYFIFKNIVRLFNLKFCLYLLSSYGLIALIVLMIRVINSSYTPRPYVIVAIIQILNLPIFVRFWKKMDIAAKALGL